MHFILEIQIFRLFCLHHIMPVRIAEDFQGHRVKGQGHTCTCERMAEAYILTARRGSPLYFKHLLKMCCCSISKYFLFSLHLFYPAVNTVSYEPVLSATTRQQERDDEADDERVLLNNEEWMDDTAADVIQISQLTAAAVSADDADTSKPSPRAPQLSARRPASHW